jgi:bifunctional polynucleotide phosphatase/kinase
MRQNQTKSKVRRIPDVGYNVYKKDFQEPNVNEGFKEVIKIDFEPRFDSPDDEKLFKQWTS